MDSILKSDLISNRSVLIISGILEYDKSFIKKMTINKFSNESETVTLNQKKFYKDYFYPEFRNIMFLQNEDFSSTILCKSFQHKIQFGRKSRDGEIVWLDAELVKTELYLFPNGSGLFSIHLNPGQNVSLSSISDLVDVCRNFKGLVNYENNISEWVNVIENSILCGHLLRGDKVSVDDYSGTKFKSYLVIDLQDFVPANTRQELLYDLGCGVPIGSAGGNSMFTPSDSYYASIMSGKISVFNTWDALPLFDSFTVIGNSLLDDNAEVGKLASWSKTYFRIYLFNLFFKFSLFRYNSLVHQGTVKVRDEFEKFANAYDISHISFNFLPNILFQQNAKALDTTEELKRFRERINRLSVAIQEEEQKRSNILLTAVGLITSLNSIEPFLEYKNRTQEFLNWPPAVFYPVLTIVLLIVGLPVLAFLFPEKWKAVKRWWKERKS